MPSIGDLVVNLTANNRDFNKKMRSSQGTVKGFAESTAMSLAGTVAAFASTGAAVSAVRRQLEELDSVAKTSRKLGIDPVQLQRLQHAFELTGVAAKTGEVAMQRMTRRLADAAKGAGPAAKALQQMGLDARQLSQLSPDQALFRIADAFAEVDSQSERVKLAFSLFDSEGVALVNTLQDGSVALRQLTQDAADLGVGVSAEDLASIEAANDAWTRMSAKMDVVAAKATTALAPALEAAANSLANMEFSLKGIGKAQTLMTAIPGVGVLGLVAGMQKEDGGPTPATGDQISFKKIPGLGVDSGPQQDQNASAIAEAENAQMRYRDALRGVADEILVLRGVATETDLRLRDLAEAGVDEESLNRLQMEIDRRNELVRLAEEQADANREAERAAQVAAREKEIQEKQAKRDHLANKERELQDSQRKAGGGYQTAGLMQRGSVEALKTILGGDKRQKHLKVAEKQLAELKAIRKGQAQDDFVIQGAVA
jgi:hypothetical protein